MSDELMSRFDVWLSDMGPAALVIREHLMPVEGSDGVIFPATYAASEDNRFKGGYNIDRFPDGTSICLIDSVGSQANRIEPLFLTKPYSGLVPQVVVVAGDKRVNLLEAGHRAGDAIVRCSALQKELKEAFESLQKGDAEQLAKIAPTSLVFGVWDSRGTQTKVPRLIASTIRAYDVRELTRSAAYAPPVDHIAVGNIPDYANDKEKKKYSERGWLQAIPSGTPGGVIAIGGVRRDATLHLAALRLLSVNTDEMATLKLRRYILGISLTAFTFAPSNYLRQGCNLVLDPDKPRELMEVHGDGRRLPVVLTHDVTIAYAKAVAKDFGIDPDRDTKLKAYPDREVPFQKELALIDVTDAGEGSKRSKKAAAAKAK
jgi:CRISPR-associated protein Csb1